MGKKGPKRTPSKKELWLESHSPGASKICASCRQSKPIATFWERRGKTNREVDDCRACRTEVRKANSRVKKARRAQFRQRNLALTDGKKMPWREAYLTYLNSPRWQAKRLAYWESGKPRECYVCGAPWIAFAGMDLHHRTYERLGNEDLDDLVPVCRVHHDLITEAWKRKTYPGLTLWEVTDAVRESNAR